VHLVSSDEIHSAGEPVTSESVPQPNILLIFVDSGRADHLSCYGYARETSPSIDRIAREGCLFETAITAAPFSPASYASVFSNLYPHQHGVNGDTIRIWPNTFTRLAEKMKANGYETFGVSNNDFVGGGCNATAGFDEYVDAWRLPFWIRQHKRVRRRVRKYLGRKAARWLDFNRTQCAAKGDSLRSVKIVEDRISGCSRPFFGCVVLMDPHAPYDQRHTRFVSRSRETRACFKTFNNAYMWVETMAGARRLSREELQWAIDCYDSEIRHADECIGHLYRRLAESNVLDDTIIIVAADHGEGFGEHGVWGHGFSLNDCLTQVPLIVRCPRYWRGGLRSDALVQLHDVHDLCVSVAETGRPDSTRYQHCLTQASDGEWNGRELLYSAFPVQTETLSMFRNYNPGFVAGKWQYGMMAVRSREWRYIEYDNGECELYDLLRDRQETETVHQQYPQVCADFHERLEEHRNENPCAPADGQADANEKPDQEVLDRLRALGYIE